MHLDLKDDRLDYNGAHEGKGGDPYPGPWALVMARSLDRGATWQSSVVEERLVPAERFVVFIPPFPSVAVDGSGRAHASFHDGRLGDRDVWTWTSSDGGATFGAAKRVNDTGRKDGTSQYLPKLAVAPDGRLDVAYYDRRADSKDEKNEVSLQSSFDGGKSFGPSARLSDRPFDSRIGFGSERGMPDLGSRLGLLSADERALAVWTDTRTGTDASRKQDLVRAVAEINKPGGLPGAVRSALRLLGIAMGLVGLILVLSILGPLRRLRGPGSMGRSSGEPTLSQALGRRSR